MVKRRSRRNAVRNAEAAGVPCGPTPEVRQRLGLDLLTRLVRTGTLTYANVLAAMQLRHCMESELLDLSPHAQRVGLELSLPHTPQPAVAAMPLASRRYLDFVTRRTYRAWEAEMQEAFLGHESLCWLVRQVLLYGMTLRAAEAKAKARNGSGAQGLKRALERYTVLARMAEPTRA